MIITKLWNAGCSKTAMNGDNQWSPWMMPVGKLRKGKCRADFHDYVVPEGGSSSQVPPLHSLDVEPLEKEFMNCELGHIIRISTRRSAVIIKLLWVHCCEEWPHRWVLTLWPTRHHHRHSCLSFSSSMPPHICEEMDSHHLTLRRRIYYGIFSFYLFIFSWCFLCFYILFIILHIMSDVLYFFILLFSTMRTLHDFSIRRMGCLVVSISTCILLLFSQLLFFSWFLFWIFVDLYPMNISLCLWNWWFLANDDFELITYMHI